MFKAFLEQAGLEEQEHQVEGVEWCLKKENEGVAISPEKTIYGGIIADEMGLGKTIQLVGTMYANEQAHTLIVLPKALLDQWIHVIKKMLKVKPLIYHGIWKNETTMDHLHSYPVVITTYGMIAASKKNTQSLLHQVKWDRIIFDEAHHMRNNQTNIYQGAAKLSAKIKWLVTGTPIQNKRTDLYSLCALLGLTTHYYTTPENLPMLCENFILHRTKESTQLALPPLTIHNIHIPWTDQSESDLSEDIHSTFKFSHVNKEQSCNNTPVCLRGESTLVSLLRARQACILPQLLREKYEKYVKESASASASSTSAEETAATEKIRKALSSTSKMDVVLDHILERKDDNKSKLVFCHFRGEIDYIHEILSSRGMKSETFDGRTNEKKRHAILTNNKIDVLILQIQTGCEGLNLQQFSEVYFISPHWNPAIEDQAVARCHRFGQKADVNVYRFYMSGFDERNETSTIDNYSAIVQQGKRHLMEIITSF